jgi:hypothetical protein
MYKIGRIELSEHTWVISEGGSARLEIESVVAGD